MDREARIGEIVLLEKYTWGSAIWGPVWIEVVDDINVSGFDFVVIGECPWSKADQEWVSWDSEDTWVFVTEDEVPGEVWAERAKRKLLDG